MCICDGGHGAGQMMAHDAIALGIERAQKTGSCIVGLRDSYHIGRIGHWAEQCASAGLVSIHFVNVISAPMVAPCGGTAPRLSTNPFAAGFPRGDGGPPVIVDFATSKLALGKVRVAHNKGEQVAPGVLVDAQGRPTTDPSVMFSHAGRGVAALRRAQGRRRLSLACELLGAAVFGATAQAGPPKDSAVLNSMFSVLVDPAAIGFATDYAERQSSVTAWFQSETLDGVSLVKLPGDPEREMRRTRRENGIPIDAVTISHIRKTAESVGVSLRDL